MVLLNGSVRKLFYYSGKGELGSELFDSQWEYSGYTESYLDETGRYKTKKSPAITGRAF